MKKVLVYCIALLCFVLYSCQTESLNIDETAKTTKDSEIIQKGGGSSASGQQGNGLIILYPDGTTEAEKIIKRAEYNIQEFEKCPCGDERLELWSVNKEEAANGGIEDKRATAKSDEEIEGAEYNPNIKIQEDMFIDFGGIATSDEGLTKRVGVNQGVTIAVLDTGIMYDYPGFTTPFLYNSSEDACYNNGQTELFGWNFVDDTITLMIITMEDMEQ